MTTYWIRENGNGAYCEGTIPDGAYDPSTCIFVPRKPEVWYTWNNTSHEWEYTDEHKIEYLRPIRNQELLRTDKYVVSDYFPTFTLLQQSDILTYREALRNFAENPPYDLPTCPNFMLN